MKKNTKNLIRNINQVKLIELNEAYQKVLYWFFSFPNIETGLNDLSADLKISKTTGKKIVNLLIDEGFLFRNIYGNVWRITCNLNHPYNYTRKISFNLAQVYEAYNQGLRKLILEEVGNAKAIIIFGSYRKGDDTEKSDIDIAVEVADNEDVRIKNVGELSKFGFRKKIKINLHIFSRNKIDINLFSNIANGIVLEGFLEVRP